MHTHLLALAEFGASMADRPNRHADTWRHRRVCVGELGEGRAGIGELLGNTRDHLYVPPRDVKTAEHPFARIHRFDGVHHRHPRVEIDVAELRELRALVGRARGMWRNDCCAIDEQQTDLLILVVQEEEGESLAGGADGDVFDRIIHNDREQEVAGDLLMPSAFERVAALQSEQTVLEGLLGCVGYVFTRAEACGTQGANCQIIDRCSRFCIGLHENEDVGVTVEIGVVHAERFAAVAFRYRDDSDSVRGEKGHASFADAAVGSLGGRTRFDVPEGHTADCTFTEHGDVWSRLQPGTETPGRGRQLLTGGIGQHACWIDEENGVVGRQVGQPERKHAALVCEYYRTTLDLHFEGISEGRRSCAARDLSASGGC